MSRVGGLSEEMQALGYYSEQSTLRISVAGVSAAARVKQRDPGGGLIDGELRREFPSVDGKAPARAVVWKQFGNAGGRVFDRDLSDRIREYIDADIRPRDKTLSDAMRGTANQLAAKGMIGSGNAIARFTQMATEELDVRAGIIWRAIARSHTSMVGWCADTTVSDLEEALYSYISAEADNVRRLSWSAIKAHQKNEAFLVESVTQRAQELMRRFALEAKFYSESLNQATEQGGDGRVVVQGNVSLLQTGMFATGHVSLADADTARLRQALEGLAAAIADNAEVQREQREQVLDLLRDLVAATEAEKPNAPKIAGLLAGLAASIRTIASLRGAWQVVKDAATAIGIPFD